LKIDPVIGNCAAQARIGTRYVLTVVNELVSLLPAVPLPAASSNVLSAAISFEPKGAATRTSRKLLAPLTLFTASYIADETIVNDRLATGGCEPSSVIAVSTELFQSSAASLLVVVATRVKDLLAGNEVFAAKAVVVSAMLLFPTASRVGILN